MKKFAQPFSAITVVLLSATAVIAAITSANYVSVFESDFVKTLKEKFQKFHHTNSQDRIYVQTDKSFYKPGETVWFAAYLRDDATLKPSGNSDIIHVELITPKGSTARHYKLVAKNGTAQGDFDLTGYVGGIYKLKAYTEWQKNDENALLFEKEITVQSVVMPRLKMKLDFEKKAYGKGDEVVAKLELNTNENKPLANKKVKFKAQLAGKAFEEKTVTTDASGKVNVKFALPKELNTVDGIVNALIDFEGSTESISRSIPIVLNDIKLEFFPEGGDMVSGVNNRIAFRATNEFEKAADVEGIIVDSKGVFVQQFSSFHLGMGAFEFVPKNGETYKARITKPEGILKEYELPEALKAGFVMKATPYTDKISVTVNSFRNEMLSLIAQCRGKIYYAKSFNAVRGENVITISTSDFPIGITQLTLFDSKGIARSERLVFANNNKQLHISVTTDKQQYQPREKVTMNIRVTDEEGLPVPGNFSLSVVDDNLLSFADDKQGNILSKILLEPELKEKVEEANFYFDKKEPKAEKALDYLLMTNGWRRYTWKQIEENSFAAVKFNAEKALLSGVVYDAYSGRPLSGATVKLKNTNNSAVTNGEGKFTLSGFDIAQHNQLEITALDFSPLTQTISDYTSSASYYLYNNKYRYYEAVPMTLGAAHGKGMVEKKAVKKEAFNNEMADAEFVIDVVAQEEVTPAIDVEPEPIEDMDNEGNVKAKDMVAAKTGDLRDAAFKAFDKNAGQQNKITYYRAKEFPKRKYNTTDSTRSDFASTVYWNGNLQTDRNGRAKVEFVTNDLISSFKTIVEGFGDDGSIGRTEYSFTTNQTFSMDVKVPNELVAGDKLFIPVFLKNTTSSNVNGRMVITAPKQLNVLSKVGDITVTANETKVVYLEAVASNQIGDGKLEVKFISGTANDAFTKNITVVAKGFPANISLSGQDLSKEFFINPVNVVPGSMKVTFTAYPNIMSELMSGVDAILREPYGCFEQTSSSNYPNIMVLQYLKSMKMDNPQLEARAKKLLDEGYKKLVAFETKENGYEWFGATPAHEALTAYGLIEFEDMKSVYAGVDQKMLDRTAKLLLDKRDGNGGFKKNPRALDSFGGADEDITNCYIVYALTEAGRGKEIEKEIEVAYKTAKKSNDPYMIALMANALYNSNDVKRADELVNMLINLQQEAGSWIGKKHSITRSTGKALQIETTSLVAMALMKSNSPNVASLTSAIKSIVCSRSGYGGFGSTQSTILALKALTQYASFSRKTDEAGTVEVLVNGVVVASKNFEKGEKNNIVLDGLEKTIVQGKQKVEVRFAGCKTALPYAMNISYNSTLPESSKQCVVNLETKLNTRAVKVGETLRLTATLKNITAEGQPMTMAIIGIPAGFSTQPWQLKELQEKGVIDFYEVVGNNIACYYRALAPNAVKQINLDLKAELPGEYEAPASSAYLYYTNEHKKWVGLERVFVNP
jgi:hypothetical protein